MLFVHSYLTKKINFIWLHWQVLIILMIQQGLLVWLASLSDAIDEICRWVVLTVWDSLSPSSFPRVRQSPVLRWCLWLTTNIFPEFKYGEFRKHTYVPTNSSNCIDVRAIFVRGSLCKSVGARKMHLSGNCMYCRINADNFKKQR